ncbi:hypothetical protein C8Q74DRAFT_1373975 [Fomes fomentarius]|nr:hypothetical protein C8Q74DRAFT_1373975 [Fomes fomentarius]
MDGLHELEDDEGEYDDSYDEDECDEEDDLSGWEAGTDDAETDFDINVTTSKGLTVTKLLPDVRRLLSVLKTVKTVKLRRAFGSKYEFDGRIPSGTVVTFSGWFAIPKQCHLNLLLDLSA